MVCYLCNNVLWLVRWKKNSVSNCTWADAKAWRSTRSSRLALFLCVSSTYKDYFMKNAKIPRSELSSTPADIFTTLNSAWVAVLIVWHHRMRLLKSLLPLKPIALANDEHQKFTPLGLLHNSYQAITRWYFTAALLKCHKFNRYTKKRGHLCSWH